MEISWTPINSNSTQQNLFIKHMKSKILEGVEDELKAMAEPIVIKEWRLFFYHREGKKNYQRHKWDAPGVYKACARDETLAPMQMVIVLLSF